jgi:serine/threonine protein kinase/tetratricopeptide (TPR) repeat protein
MAESHVQDAKNAAEPDLTGKTVGRFTVRARLGAGGMGEVYLADDPRLKRSVALKRLAPHLRADPAFRRRFLAEAQRASSLNDPHIAQVYDVFEENEEIFLVMELVEGSTLRRRLEAPLSIAEFLEVALQCVQALATAHDRGVLHCDLKPENIMLTQSGRVKILDFGVAKRLLTPEQIPTAETRDTDPGKLSGTPAYMSPEILLMKPSDARADIFSLGVVFYEALAGQHPFLATGLLATSDRILHETPPPPSTLNPQIPAELDRIILKTLAKEPAGRFASAHELLVSLRELARSLAYPTEQFSRFSPRLHARTLMVAGAALLVAVIAAGWGVRWLHRPPAFGARDWILVTDFDNQTGQKLFDRTVSELLRQTLQQSRYVSVVTRDQVLEAATLMGRTGLTAVDAGLGREICLREGYRALLAGRILPVGAAYEIEAQVVDPKRGSAVVSETEPFASHADLHAGVDRLARRLREHLGESLAQIEEANRPLAQVTTTSLDALERYSRALDLFAARDFENCIVLAKSALSIDPEFAMAHHLMARAYDRLGNEEGVREQLTQAKRGLDHVTEREKHLILADDYSARYLDQQAAEEYRLVLVLYPNDVEALQGLAETVFWMDRPEEAIQAERRAILVNPNSTIDYSSLMRYLIRVNRFTEVLQAFQEARARKIESRQLHWPAGIAQWGLGNIEDARREFELLRQGGSRYEENLAQLYLARLLIFEGRLREAEESLRDGLRLDEKQQSTAWIPVRLYLLARLELVRGRLAEARVYTQRLGAASREVPLPENLKRAGALELELGDPASARQFLSLLKNLGSHKGQDYTESQLSNLQGELELASGKVDQAIESQLRAAAFLRLAPEPHASLGKLYGMKGDWHDAVKEYQQYLQFKGMIFHDDFPSGWVLAHLWLARAFANAGDTRQALHYYDEFLRLWAGADSDLPPLRQARAERQKLGSNVPGLYRLPSEKQAGPLNFIARLLVGAQIRDRDLENERAREPRLSGTSKPSPPQMLR